MEGKFRAETYLCSVLNQVQSKYLSQATSKWLISSNEQVVYLKQRASGGSPPLEEGQGWWKTKDSTKSNFLTFLSNPLATKKTKNHDQSN